MPRWAWTGRTGGRTEVERSPWGRVASETGQRVRRWVAIDAPVPARVAADEGRCHARFRLSRNRRNARWTTRHSVDRVEQSVPAPSSLATRCRLTGGCVTPAFSSQKLSTATVTVRDPLPLWAEVIAPPR